MDKYDPLQPPDPEAGPALDEGRRMGPIAALHTIVENQAAMGDETAVWPGFVS